MLRAKKSPFVEKMSKLKGKLYEARKNADFLTESYNEERIEREELQAEAKGLRNLLELQEVRVKIRQEELRIVREKVEILETEVHHLKSEKLKVLSGLTEVLGVLKSEKDKERVMPEEESEWADVPEDYESDW